MSTIINTESNVTCRKTSKTGYMFKMEVIVNSYDSANNYWNVTVNHYSYGYNGKWYYNTTGPTSKISTTTTNESTTTTKSKEKGKTSKTTTNKTSARFKFRFKPVFFLSYT